MYLKGHKTECIWTHLVKCSEMTGDAVGWWMIFWPRTGHIYIYILDHTQLLCRCYQRVQTNLDALFD